MGAVTAIDGGTMPPTRREHDLLGERDVPADALWGIHSLRAQENFALSGVSVSDHPRLVIGLAAVKEAAALANHTLGLLDGERTEAILAACEEIRRGRLHDQFVVDVVQGGAGTSTNMNANEVIANRALERLGRPRGAYEHLHPNEHVNLSQSTNDVYPTAVRLATIEGLASLRSALLRLAAGLRERGDEHHDAVRLGRTQLQDAVPTTFGRTFVAHAHLIEDAAAELERSASPLHTVNLGGTAIGTGIAAPAPFGDLACEQLARIVGRPVRPAVDRVAATQDTGGLVQASAATRRVAVVLSRLANDLRLLGSGPAGGLGELRLPAVQAGSSLMPGKVNPVIPELVNQVAFEAIGRDLTVTLAAEAGQLELNAFGPTIFRAVDQNLSQLASACDRLNTRCVAGMVPVVTRAREAVERSPVALVTALAPRIGYAAATSIAKKAATTGQSIAELVAADGLLEAAEWDAVVADAGGISLAPAEGAS